MRPERNSFDEEDMDYDAQELYEYIEAKKKVLFEGFEFKSEINYFWIFSLKGRFPTTIPKKFTLENLANNSVSVFQLTEAALNQIYGTSETLST